MVFLEDSILKTHGNRVNWNVFYLSDKKGRVVHWIKTPYSENSASLIKKAMEWQIF
jgi:hypothetical protein